MKNRNLVLLVLAIGCGLVAAFLTAKLSAGNRTEMVPVLVAAKNLDQGTKLDKPEELFVRKPFPKESVPPDFLDDLNTLKGKILQRTIRPGTHVTLEDITPRDSIQLPIVNGVMYKAMAIRVTQESIIGGLVSPGSRVDVVATERQTNGKTASTVILQYVLVVAVNDAVRRPEDGSSFKQAQTVSLAVTQKEGMVLAMAKERGTISLMLRSPEDTKVSKGKNTVSEYGDTREEANSDGGRGPDSSTAKVVIAKKTVPAGTKLDNPEEYFDIRDWPGDAPENSLATLEEIKGRTVTREVFAHNFVPREAFDSLPAKPDTDATVKLEPSKTHTMTIQIGASTPQFLKYDKDGRLLEGSGIGIGAGPASVPSAPSTKRDSSPTIEPEKPGKSEDKPGKNDF
jgi:Flp pilus assembly protein CpaB